MSEAPDPAREVERLVEELHRALAAPARGSWGAGAVARVPIGRAARALGLSRETLRIWCRDGRIPGAVQQGGVQRVWKVPALWLRAAAHANTHGLPIPLRGNAEKRKGAV